MSDTEQESMSERELAQWMESELYSDKPKSVGEALAAGEQPPEEVPVESEPAPEEPPVVVTDEPVQPPAPEPEEREPTDEEREALEDVEQREPEDEGDPNVVWAKKKYGEDVGPKAARALFEQERMISRISAEKKEAEELAGQWYDYAQQVETQQPQVQLPLSSQEEAWADQAMANPVQYAAQAAMQGNIQLYNAIIERVAYQDPRQASAVETEVRLQLIAAAEHEAQQQPSQQDFQQVLAAAVQRAGIDIPTYGQPMIEKITELGEHHPYVQTIMEGDDAARDIALMAVLDMVRSSSLSTRKVRNDSREEQLRREGELRKQAAGVVTGGGSRNPQEKASPFMEAMEQEWRDRGQWTSEE